MTKTPQIEVTAIMHGDTGVITAFVNELPGLLVQGNSKEDVNRKLKAVLNSYIERLKRGSFAINTQTV